MRELRNLVESMVVLAPGPRDPARRHPARDARAAARRSLLPVPLGRAITREGDGEPRLRPELEFIFRTLVELRVDMDDLRREFEAYREDLGVRGARRRPAGRDPHPPAPEPSLPGNGYAARPPSAGVVVYRPGMTMDELERAAILAALRDEGGNRRRAAEVLGIGERTLYRKIKQYGLEV